MNWPAAVQKVVDLAAGSRWFLENRKVFSHNYEFNRVVESDHCRIDGWAKVKAGIPLAQCRFSDRKFSILKK
jgi:hypothetical protein